MEIFRHYTGLPAGARGGAVAIGNFDGIHLGHQFVIAKAGTLARGAGAPSGMLTFEPHPRSVFPAWWAALSPDPLSRQGRAAPRPSASTASTISISISNSPR